jgi:hypothetical protein
MTILALPPGLNELYCSLPIGITQVDPSFIGDTFEVFVSQAFALAVEHRGP